MTDTLDTQTVAAVVERKKLQRHFGVIGTLFWWLGRRTRAQAGPMPELEELS